MSVTAVTKNGKPCWQVQVIRGSRRIRRFLDRKTSLRQDALRLERQLLNALDDEIPVEPDQGGPTQASPTSPPTPTTTTTTPTPKTTRAKRSPPAPVAQPAPTPAPTPTPAVLTFAAFAERYLALQDTSRSDYRNKVRNVRMHLVPFFGDLPLAALTRLRIDELRVHLRSPSGDRASSRRSITRVEAPVTRRRKGGPRSPKTINNVLATLRTILHLAADYELIDRIPRIPFEADARKDPVFLDFPVCRVDLNP